MLDSYQSWQGKAIDLTPKVIIRLYWDNLMTYTKPQDKIKLPKHSQN